MENNKFKKIIAGLMVCSLVTFSAPKPAKADLWGGDVVVLLKILANALMQLQKLQMLVSSTQDSLNMARDLNSGINEVMNLMQTSFPDSNLNVYKDCNNLQTAVREMQTVYGHAVNSKESASQGDLDRSITEAILNVIFSCS